MTCAQLGFKNGTFSFVSFATNDSMYMLYHKPECRGDENHIMDCPGSARVQIGSRICGVKSFFFISVRFAQLSLQNLVGLVDLL